MLNRFKFLGKQQHICFAYLESPTAEHNDALKDQWDLTTGISCQMDFEMNSFSLAGHSSKNSRINNAYLDGESVKKHLRATRSLAVFLQSPYSEHYPDWFVDFSADLNFAFAGYGISLSNYLDGQFRTPLIQSSRYLLASSNYDVNGYKLNCSSSSEVILTGNPLMYEIRKSLVVQSDLKQPMILRFLWAPHWSKFWLQGRKGFARWQITVEPILKFASDNPNIQVVIRPHPILHEALISHLKTGKDLNRESQVSIDTGLDSEYLLLFQTLLSLKNVSFSKSSLKEDVLNSSHLVTDGVSIIAYWATTGKPILVVKDSESPSFNEDGIKLINEIDVASDSTEISHWLQHVTLNVKNGSHDSLVDLSKKLHPTFLQSPAEIFKRSIE